MPVMFGFGAWVLPVFGMVFIAFLARVVLSQGVRHGLSSGHNRHYRGGCGVPMMQDSHSVRSFPDSFADPLAIARERYAQGLISQKEFDTLVEGLLKTEREQG